MKTKDKLNAQESTQYMAIVLKGNMDDMFDWAYTLGAKHELEKMQDEMDKFTQGFAYKPKK